MNLRALCLPAFAIVVASLAGDARADVEGVRILFMEPAGPVEKGALPVYRLVSEVERVRTYAGWVDNKPARMAMDLYRRAWRLTHPADQAAVYYVALVPGGNHADLGFRLKNGEAVEEHDTTAYIKLDAEEWVFSTTLLHETGHVVISLLNGGAGIPTSDLASIPHTTAALTDRGRAFNEGFSIHLETLAAHFTDDPVVVERYQHERFQFGPQAQRKGEYFRPSMDLLTYSQTRTRYYDVRENAFSFAAAFKGPDYLRVQLDRSRDFATLRDADQLLQSEGFYATFFFGFLVRGSSAPTPELVHSRQDKLLSALAEMFRTERPTADTPHLLRFVETYLRVYPSESGEIVDVLLDASRGVFVDTDAATLWRDHYLGALRLDLAEKDNKKIAEARAAWRAKVMADPKALYSRLGPQIRCEVASVSVRLVAFGEASPLVFDVNTAEEGVIRLIPGITDAQVASWLSQRQLAPFRDASDFAKRSGLSEATRSAMNLSAPQP